MCHILHQFSIGGYEERIRDIESEIFCTHGLNQPSYKPIGK